MEAKYNNFAVLYLPQFVYLKHDFVNDRIFLATNTRMNTNLFVIIRVFVAKKGNWEVSCTSAQVPPLTS
jgi:hypothetical protein